MSKYFAEHTLPQYRDEHEFVRWALKKREYGKDWYINSMTILEVEEEDVIFGIDSEEDSQRLAEYMAKLKDRKEVYLAFFKEAQESNPLFNDYRRLIMDPIESLSSNEEEITRHSYHYMIIMLILCCIFRSCEGHQQQVSQGLHP